MREDKYCEGYIPWITKITPVPKPYTFADALADIGEEYLRAAKMYPPMNSAHEGYAVIKEEFEELWEEIRLKNPNRDNMKVEATQVGAMALRFLVDVIAHRIENGKWYIKEDC